MNVELDPTATQPLPGSIGAMLAGDAAGAAAAPAAPPATGAPAAPASPDAAPADGGPIKPDEVSGAKTPEEIEAYWRNRVSRKDAAHAAAERTLREQITSLQAKPAATGSNGQPGTGEGNEALADLQRQLDEERAARVVDQRKGKYPALVAQGVSDETFRSSNEADLAKMNALADDTAATGFMAPTAPRRSTTPPAAAKPLHERSKAELENDLRAISPAYAESLRQG